MNKGIEMNVRLLYTDFHKISTWWDFSNLTSSFYRVYLISKGECDICLEEEHLHLCEGDMFLIPKFVRASYWCNSYMEQYYICLIDGEQDTCAVSDTMALRKQLKASELDKQLFRRLVEISPGRALPSVFPDEYDNRKELLLPSREADGSAAEMEQRGIITYLFAKFLTLDSFIDFNLKRASYSRIPYIIQYINDNISSDLSVRELAGILCLSPDYFNKLFHKIMGISPKEYISMKRLDRAKLLLDSTDLPISEVASRIGLPEKSHFSNFFLSRTGLRPGAYRKRQV